MFNEGGSVPAMARPDDAECQVRSVRGSGEPAGYWQSPWAVVRHKLSGTSACRLNAGNASAENVNKERARTTALAEGVNEVDDAQIARAYCAFRPGAVMS
jgi:hypothetical protein